MTVSSVMYWDPVAVLKIDPSDAKGVKCQGTTREGRQCGNSVALEGGRGNLRPYIRPVGSIPIDKVTAADLEPMAQWVLCKGVHRKYPAQVDAIIREWCMKLDHVTARSASNQRTTVDTQALKRRVAEAEVSAPKDDIQSVCIKLQQQLWESQRRLTEQETECKNLRAKKDILKGETQKLEARNSEIAKLVDLLERESHRKAETYREQLEAVEAEKASLREEIKRIRVSAVFKSKRHNNGSNILRNMIKEERLENRRLRGEVELMTNSFDDEVVENKRLTQNLRDQELHHVNEVADLRRQLVEKDTALKKSSHLVRDLRMNLQQEKQSATTEIEHLKAENHRIRVRSSLQALMSRVMLSIKQRKADEVKSDNEALLEQHKHLQHAMSEIASELQTAEVCSLIEISVIDLPDNHHRASSHQ